MINDPLFEADYFYFDFLDGFFEVEAVGFF